MPDKLFTSAAAADLSGLPKLDTSVVLTHEWRSESGGGAGTPGVLWAGVARKN